MKRQVAVVAVAGNGRRRVLVDPNVGHAGAADDCAWVDVGRRAVEQDARAALRIVAGDHATDRFGCLLHISFVLDARGTFPDIGSPSTASRAARKSRAAGEKTMTASSARARRPSLILAMTTITVVLAASLLPDPGRAQDFPNRTIRLVVGPSPDVLSRIIAGHLQRGRGGPGEVEPWESGGGKRAAG